MTFHVDRRRPHPFGVISEQTKSMIALGTNELSDALSARFCPRATRVVMVNGKPRRRAPVDRRFSFTTDGASTVLCFMHLCITLSGNVVHVFQSPMVQFVGIGFGIPAAPGVPTGTTIGRKAIPGGTVPRKVGVRLVFLALRTTLYGFHQRYTESVPS